jgi:ATP-dependent Clp protease ATP-binding subunit ClpB
LGRRLSRRDLSLDVSQGARQLIGELGWDPQYGARPLKRAIQRYLEDPLAQRLLAGEFGPGDVISADRTPDGQLAFERKMLN